MGNMSYCRFENTLKDLRDCYQHMEENPCSDEEEKARKALIKLCLKISDEYSETDDET
jgi:hypothetical protein